MDIIEAEQKITLRLSDLAYGENSRVRAYGDSGRPAKFHVSAMGVSHSCRLYVDRDAELTGPKLDEERIRSLRLDPAAIDGFRWRIGEAVGQSRKEEGSLEVGIRRPATLRERFEVGDLFGLVKQPVASTVRNIKSGRR